MSEFTNKFKNMRYFKILLLTLFIINFSCDFQKTNEISESEISSRANEILNMMTLEEKVGQMTQINLTVIAKGPNKWSSSFPMEIDNIKAQKALVDFKVEGE